MGFLMWELDLPGARSRPPRAAWSPACSPAHEPEASHLGVLEAVAGRELVDRAYAAMTAPGAPPYRWHEFGDAMLLLPLPG